MGLCGSFALSWLNISNIRIGNQSLFWCFLDSESAEVISGYDVAVYKNVNGVVERDARDRFFLCRMKK